MSVIVDCQPGDRFYCIGEFHASPDGQGFSWQTSRKFRVGDRFRYLGFRQNANSKDRPTGWFVVFEAGNGKRYAATQTYFVTEDEWECIKKYFVRRAVRQQKWQQVGSKLKSKMGKSKRKLRVTKGQQVGRSPQPRPAR